MDAVLRRLDNFQGDTSSMITVRPIFSVYVVPNHNHFLVCYKPSAVSIPNAH